MSNFNYCQVVFSGNQFETRKGVKVDVIDFYPADNKELRDFLKNKSGIYFWINLLDNKIYIGSSKNLWRRFLSYYNSFRTNNDRNNKKLKGAIKKHGLINFRFGLLRILINNDDLLKKEEQTFFDILSPFEKNGYNILKYTTLAYTSKMSEQGRLNIKLRHTGENSEMSKLTNEKVKIIKNELAKGQKLKILAEKFGISTTVVSNIKRGLTWSHIKIDDNNEKILKQKSEENKHKFTEDFIRLIRTELKNGIRQCEIARKYNLIYSTVHSIKNYHIYSDIHPL